ncbi:hypothetical protein [Helicobacter sp. T3_23-1059]
MSQTQSLVSTPKIPKNYKSHTATTSIVIRASHEFKKTHKITLYAVIARRIADSRKAIYKSKANRHHFVIARAFYKSPKQSTLLSSY